MSASHHLNAAFKCASRGGARAHESEIGCFYVVCLFLAIFLFVFAIIKEKQNLYLVYIDITYVSRSVTFICCVCKNYEFGIIPFFLYKMDVKMNRAEKLHRRSVWIILEIEISQKKKKNEWTLIPTVRLRLHSYERRHVEVTSTPSKNYELESHSSGSFLLENRKLAILTHPWLLGNRKIASQFLLDRGHSLPILQSKVQRSWFRRSTFEWCWSGKMDGVNIFVFLLYVWSYQI